MPRECRMVERGWEHPKNREGFYIPLKNYYHYHYDMSCFMSNLAEYGLQYAIEKYDSIPDKRKYMPNWSLEQKQLYMMYETTSEGPPTSPSFETPAELANWLVEHQINFFGPYYPTFDEWLEGILNSNDVIIKKGINK